MKLLFIRHGHPDYEHDCLTERDRAEAEALAKRLTAMEIDLAFTSPMGRAKETALFFTALSGIRAEEREWLHEFDVKINDISTGEREATWDISPKIWTKSRELFDIELKSQPEFVGTDYLPRAQAAAEGIDELLKSLGLVREGRAYRRTGDTDKTVALFCHFGATCIALSHLLNIPPMVALNSFSAEPTAIATVCTDDRFGEAVNFRLHGFGDISHLGVTAAGGTVDYK